MDTAIAFIAHDGGPGMNVHIDGMPCIDCDPHFDPMRRTGVPCQYAYAHAKHTVHAWWFNGIRDARVSLVEVADTGDYASMVAVARERLAARDGMASAPSTTATAPAGAARGGRGRAPVSPRFEVSATNKETGTW